MEAKDSPPDTAVGAKRVEVVPSPSWPDPLLPQQYADVSCATAQAWAPPFVAVTDHHVRPPANTTGALRFDVVPSPSCPNELTPEHKTNAPVVIEPVARPQVNWLPSVSDCHVSPPLTATGEARFTLVPSPSCPLVFRPQQYATPPDVSPQLWSVPTRTEANTTPPATATGVPFPVPASLSPSCP